MTKIQFRNVFPLKITSWVVFKRGARRTNNCSINFKHIGRGIFILFLNHLRTIAATRERNESSSIIKGSLNGSLFYLFIYQLPVEDALKFQILESQEETVSF